MSYKKIYGVAILMIMSLQLLAQDKSFTLSGKLANVKDGSKIYVYYYTPKIKKDSATLQNGMFEFKGSLNTPFTAQLLLLHAPKPAGAKLMLPIHGNFDFLNLYIDEGVIKLNGTDSVKTISVKNSKINDDDQRLSEILNRLRRKIDLLNHEFKSASVEQKNGISKEEDKAYQDIDAAKIQFARENPESYVSLNAIFELARGRAMDFHKVNTEYQLLSNRYKNTFLAKEAEEFIATGINTTVGAQALDFTQPDANGKLHKVSDFRGKYLLLEFWASWCSPCRKESPNLVRAYEKYKNKNFTIMAVSLDKNRDAWFKAIEEDKLPYLQVNDLQGPGINAAAVYGVQSIPESYIIDPNGKIIAKNLRGEALNKKLSELFN